MVTDDGPDQKGCSKLLIDKIKASGTGSSANIPVPGQPDQPSDQPSLNPILYFRYKCMLHQLHLVVSKQLQRLNGHYTSVAKIVNVWRSVGIPFKIHQLYQQKFGQDAAKVVRRLPPRPLKGRWGSIASAEGYLLSARPLDLRAIFKVALGAIDAPADREEDESISLNVLAGGDMDNSVYRKIMGRWRRDAIAALEDPSFWTQVLISFNSKQPLNHLMHFLMSKAKSDNDDPRSYADSRGKLPELVYGKLDAIAASFRIILDPKSSCWQGLWGDLLMSMSPTDVERTVRCLVASTLEIASELDRRVATLVKGYPAQLTWLILQPPEDFCEHRMKCCKDFLATEAACFVLWGLWEGRMCSVFH